MPMHPDLKIRLLTELKKGVASLRVKHSQFVDSFISFMALHGAEQVLPQTGKVRASLESWIGDTPLFTFVTSRVDEQLSEKAIYESDEALVRLADIEGFEDSDAISEGLVEEFESLPWHYTLSTRFPDALPTIPKDRTTTNLGPNARLAVCDLFFRGNFPLEHPDDKKRKRILNPGMGLLLLGEEFNWQDDAAYFQFDAVGYIGPYGQGTQFDEANRALRRFVGLALGLKLFTHSPQYKPFPTKRFWLVHREVGGARVLHNRLELDAEDSAMLDGLKLWNGFEKSYPADHKEPWLQGLLFLNVSGSLSVASASNLGLAAEWFFDSFKGRDEILTYVRRMTCLEILLGEHADSSKVSLGDILSNRLAYLIGKSHADREKVLEEFREIYKLRSRILHHGKHRFTSKERTTLWTLRSFCERALQAEAELHEADAKGKS